MTGARTARNLHRSSLFTLGVALVGAVVGVVVGGEASRQLQADPVPVVYELAMYDTGGDRYVADHDLTGADCGKARRDLIADLSADPFDVACEAAR